MAASLTAPASVTLLQMCRNLGEVKQLHAQFVASGLLPYPLYSRRLLASYVSMSQVYTASSIFERMPRPDVFAYNTMIRGLILGKCPDDALLLYNKMLLRCLLADNYTYTFVLKACSHRKALLEGKQIHCQVIKAGIARDTHIHSSLIHMYSNSGSIDNAERVVAEFTEENTLAKNSMISGYFSEAYVEKAKAIFENMAQKDDATWSAMITGYTKNGMHSEALTLFQDMMLLLTLPNESALVSLLSACAHLGALQQGRWIHTYIDRNGIKMTTRLSTALIDMYSKCGSIECAYKLFQKMPERDIVTWGVMISAFAIHGQARKCFQLFDEMLSDGIHPNEVICVAILSACSHAGYIKEGQDFFNRIVYEFGIRPSVEHYGCMVDLLGRAGRLAEAEELILSMPERPNSVIWGSLLSACRDHNDLRRGTWAFRHLVELEPTSGDRYKQAGLMFANAGEKEKEAEIRKMIKEKEMKTVCGSSYIEVDGTIHEFLVGDIIHNEARQIYGMCRGIDRLLKSESRGIGIL